jgi:hypothetical protein
MTIDSCGRIYDQTSTVPQNPDRQRTLSDQFKITLNDVLSACDLPMLLNPLQLTPNLHLLSPIPSLG